MKIVRESINEIKQDKESGLGAIGIGKNGMYHIYKKLISIQPDIAKIEPMTISRPNWLFNEDHPMYFFKDKIPEIMHVPLSQIIRLNWQSLSFNSEEYLKPLFRKELPDVEEFIINVKDEDDEFEKAYPVIIYFNEKQGGAFMRYHDTVLNASYRYFLIIKPY
jgi:hypothetical protein